MDAFGSVVLRTERVIVTYSVALPSSALGPARWATWMFYIIVRSAIVVLRRESIPPTSGSNPFGAGCHGHPLGSGSRSFLESEEATIVGLDRTSLIQPGQGGVTFLQP